MSDQEKSIAGHAPATVVGGVRHPAHRPRSHSKEDDVPVAETSVQTGLVGSTSETIQEAAATASGAVKASLNADAQKAQQKQSQKNQNVKSKPPTRPSKGGPIQQPKGGH